MDERIEAEIKELMKSGHKIAAIKRYREITGSGLAEAKAAVESLETGGSLTEPVERVETEEPELTRQIVNLLDEGKKIKAIKLYRERLGVDLRDA